VRPADRWRKAKHVGQTRRLGKCFRNRRAWLFIDAQLGAPTVKRKAADQRRGLGTRRGNYQLELPARAPTDGCAVRRRTRAGHPAMPRTIPRSADEPGGGRYWPSPSGARQICLTYSGFRALFTGLTRIFRFVGEVGRHYERLRERRPSLRFSCAGQFGSAIMNWPYRSRRSGRCSDRPQLRTSAQS
jgi:hypothetical protein